MALQKFGNLTEFWRNKSIKLSDAFDVLVRYAYYDKNKHEIDYTRLVSCTGFTLPKLEYNEETYEYGNVAQVFQIPKYDSCKELTLDFIERIEDKNYSVTLSKVFELMGYKLTQKFSQGLMTNKATYNIDQKIPELIIKIANNKLWRYKYQYHFNNLKIINYSMYNLDYQGEQPCKITVTLSFESFIKEIIDEPIFDDVEKQQNNKENPNGKVSVDGIEIEGNPNANKEDIELNWKESVNKDDLAMIENENLLNPLFGELPDDIDDDSEDISPEIRTEMYKQSINEEDLAMFNTRPELAELEMIELDEESNNSSNPPIENQTTDIGQIAGGYKQPGIGSNGNSTGGEDAYTASMAATQKNNQLAKNTDTKQTNEKTYGGLTAKELGTRAAQMDKQNPNGSFKTAAMNAVGLDKNERNKVESAYNAEMKKS